MNLWEPLLAIPVLPATLLLMLVVFWSVLTLFGGAVLHGHHFHVDAHADGDASDLFSSMGSVTMRWLNASEMPLMLWLCVFSLTWWSISISLFIALDAPWLGKPGTVLSIVLIVRNFVLAALVTKLLTRPFRGWTDSESLTSQSLIGQECEICSWEATTEYGQVRFKTDGAPLLLNVRTDGPDLPKGTRVWITHYDAARRAYIVSPTSQGDSSCSNQ